MPSQVYKWKRFWCPRSGSINLADGDYLPNPDSDWGRACNPELIDFETIVDRPCLVLLGEAGMGKTTAIEESYKQVYERVKDSEDVCLPLFRLGDYSSDTDLCTAIFQSQAVQAWRQSHYKLHLYLDSLDEGRLSISNLVRILKREIEKLPCDRLYFRITCRTAEWAFSLEEKLEEKWGKDNVSVCKIAPLRRVDVIEAANQNSINSDEFLQEVFKRNAIPLAIKPVTLNFLLDVYAQKRQLPASQEELYEKSCLQLCEEVNSDRREAGFQGQLSAKKRRLLAGRIAAVMLFSNRSAVWTSPEYGKIPDSDILLQDLCIGKEEVDEHSFDVDEDCIREVFSITGLFSVQNLSHRIGFAHRTYAEFLAAWYLKQHQLKLPQILKLIVHSDDSDNRIVPQLHETVAWLSSMVPGVFQKVMETDPNVLLRSDVETTSDSDRSSLVGNLLRLYDKGKLVHNVLNNYRDYKKLTHQGLSEQLRLYICDAAKSLNARYVAIDIAEACEQKSLQNELADIALTFSEPMVIRRNAASAICRIGDAFTKERLKPLALVDSGDDPDDEIKGYALKAVYPNHITVHELFNAITRPKAKFFGGAYQRFIANEIVEHFQPIDLLIALEWVEQKPYRGLQYPFQQLVDAILFKAWECLDDPEILQIFARIAIERWRNHEALFSDRHDPPFEDTLTQNDEKRYQLLKTIVSILPSLEQKPMWLLGSRTGIVLQKDILWMLERVKQARTEQEMYVWSSLIRRTFRYPEQMPEEAKAILDGSQTNSILHNEFSFWLKTIDLDSAEAVKIYTAYLQEQAWQNHYQSVPLVEPPPEQRIITCLDSFEAGNFQSWWSLNLEMTLLPTSQYYDNVCGQLDITKLPGWKNADAITRSRIVKAAEIFIQNWKSESSGLDLHEIDVAAYKALRLLLVENPDYLLTAPLDIWKQFVRIFLLIYPYTSDSRYVECHHALMKIAYHHAPQEALDTLIALMDRDNRQHGDVDTIKAFRECWDDKSLSALSEKLMDKALSPKSFGRLLEVLLSHNFEKTLEIVKSFIPLPLPSDFQERSKAVFAAIAFMLYTRDAGWTVIWQAVRQDPNFGREIFKKISYLVKWDGNLELKLQESYIADLYIFLAKEFPQPQKQIEEDSNSSKDENFDANEINLKDYEIDEEDSINIWKSYIPQRLQERGTREACAALRKIIHELPELKDNLQWRLSEAEVLTRRQTWQALQPEQILQIVSKKELPTMKTILILASSPVNEARLRLDKEVREINEGLRRSQKRDQFKIEQRWAVQTDDLRRALLDTEPQIVHFCGHGTGSEGILVEDNDGHSKLVSTEALASLFELCADHVECVLLNACYSEVQADAIVQHIAHVIGMSDAIGDTAAIKFSTGFYDAIGAGKSIEDAYKFGCNAIQLENIPEYLIPKHKKK